MLGCGMSPISVLFICWLGCDSKPDNTRPRVFVVHASLCHPTTVAEAFAVFIPKEARHNQPVEECVSCIPGPEGTNQLTKEHAEVIHRPWTYDPDQVGGGVRSAMDAESRSSPAASSSGDGNVR